MPTTPNTWQNRQSGQHGCRILCTFNLTPNGGYECRCQPACIFNPRNASTHIMRKVFLTIFVLLVPLTFVFPQNYKLVDSIVRTYPKRIANPDDLASYISRDFVLQEEKARAIFTWIALNIEYDLQAITKPKGVDSLKIVEELQKRKEEQCKEGIIQYTLRKGKGICVDYSILFQFLCEHVSLKCEIIDGAAKNGVLNIDSYPNSVKHIWNAVKIGNEWKLIDVTWAAGYYDEKSGRMVQEFNDFFFFTPPKQFAYSHFPTDSRGMLTGKSKESFDEAPVYYPTYFQRNIIIEKPRKGKISTGRKGLLRFVFTNCNSECLYFKFVNEHERRVVCPKVSNEKRIYEVEYKYSNDTYLTIFSNEHRIAKYLITK
jgi:hypothetical protein